MVKIGATLEPQIPIATVEGTKAVEEVLAPVSGKVVQINGELESSPELLENVDDENWVVNIEDIPSDEAKKLMSEEEYKKYCE